MNPENSGEYNNGENEVSPEVACSQEVETLCRKYGVEAVRTALMKIESEQTDNTERDDVIETPPIAEVETGPLGRLREILSRDDVPVYVNTRLDNGQKLFGRGGDGYQTYYLGMDKPDPFLGKILPHIIPLQKSWLPQGSSNSDFRSRGFSFVRAEGFYDDGSTAIAITYYVNKGDQFGRASASTFVLVLKPEEVDEIEEILKTTDDPNTAVDIFLQRIASASDGGEELPSIAPHGDFVTMVIATVNTSGKTPSSYRNNQQKPIIRTFQPNN